MQKLYTIWLCWRNNAAPTHRAYSLTLKKCQQRDHHPRRAQRTDYGYPWMLRKSALKKHAGERRSQGDRHQKSRKKDDFLTRGHDMTLESREIAEI